MKYPHIYDGLIAESAPILSFELDDFESNYGFNAQGLTYDVEGRRCCGESN